MKFTVIVTQDPEESGIYNASVPALPGCRTWGESIDEALENAKDAIETYLLASVETGDPIPLEVARSTISVKQ